MIEAKEAAQAAVKHLMNLSGSGLLREPKEILLEEIEFDDKQRIWRITLSYVHDLEASERDPMSVAIANLALSPPHKVTPRIYRTFELLGGNGDFKSMKLRSPDARG